MKPDPRLEWCRENIPRFKDYHDQVLRVAEDERANREEFAAAALAALPKLANQGAES